MGAGWQHLHVSGEAEEARRLLRAQPAVHAPLVESAPPDEVFTRVIAAVCGALDWSFGAIWRPSPGGGDLHCAAAWTVPGPGRDEFERRSSDLVFGPGEGLPGRAWSTGGAVWLADAGRAPASPRADLAREAGLHTHVAFPLLLGDAFEGVMELLADESRAPSDQLLAWFSSLGVQLGQYLARWRSGQDLAHRDRALAAAGNGVVIADATRPGSPLVYASPGFERLTGYAAHEVLGRPWSALEGVDTDLDAAREIADALAGLREYRGTLLSYRRDGTPFWNEIALSPVRDADGAVTQIVATHAASSRGKEPVARPPDSDRAGLERAEPSPAESAGDLRLRADSANRPRSEAAHVTAEAVRALGAGDRLELERLLVPGGVHAAFQPIVDLDTSEVVAYEALARGPEGSALERPELMFDAARRGGRLADLDWACRAAAFAGALEGELEPPLALFVNVEPDALDAPCPEHLTRLEKRAGDRLRIVLEITERALTARPAELLHAIERLRAVGWEIALDDVGSDTRSLALMPLLRPDVIKLDLRLVQAQPTLEIAEIVNAVNAERERTGAVVIAEGIETEAHLVTARALGATLAQGWLFGRPGRLPLAAARPPAPDRALASIARPLESVGRTPYDAVSGVRETRVADKRLLLSISLRLEQQAAAIGETAVVLSAFQSAERFTAATRRRYAALAGQTAFVGALGVGVEGEPAPGVRGAHLDPDDPLLDEWSVVVLGPHFAAALVSRELGGAGGGPGRRFEFALTYDRALVIEAAGTLMRRVIPVGVAPVATGAR